MGKIGFWSGQCSVLLSKYPGEFWILIPQPPALIDSPQNLNKLWLNKIYVKLISRQLPVLASCSLPLMYMGYMDMHPPFLHWCILQYYSKQCFCLRQPNSLPFWWPMLFIALQQYCRLSQIITQSCTSLSGGMCYANYVHSFFLFV